MQINSSTVRCIDEAYTHKKTRNFVVDWLFFRRIIPTNEYIAQIFIHHRKSNVAQFAKQLLKGYTVLDRDGKGSKNSEGMMKTTKKENEPPNEETKVERSVSNGEKN